MSYRAKAGCKVTQAWANLCARAEVKRGGRSAGEQAHGNRLEPAAWGLTASTDPRQPPPGQREVRAPIAQAPVKMG